MLAKHTHAPNLQFFYLGTRWNSVDPAITDLARLTIEPEVAYTSSRALMSHHDILSLTARGFCDLQFLRPIEIDAYGNVNTSVIGSRERPRYRFHGIAVADAMILVRRPCLYVTDHDQRVFREELTYRTGTGHVEGDAWRARIGAPGGGPAAIVTPLGVLDFETPDRRARLRSVHPGTSVAEVQAATGFELDVSGVVESVPPSEEELRVLREVVDPLATRHLEFKRLRGEARNRILVDEAERARD
jgi:glutaconate CoA-transferase subunit B